MAKFATIERSTAPGKAIEQIKQLVAAGELKPGDRIPPERDLSLMLGISRPTAREAIQALAAMGVLQIRQGSGTYVTSLSSEILAHPLTFVLSANPAVLKDLFGVRQLLEVGAAELAAQRADDDLLERIAKLDEMLASELDNVEAFVEGDIVFHRMIHQAAGNLILTAMMESISVLGRQSRMVTAQERWVRLRTLAEHRAIYDALHSHNPEMAGETMRMHLRHVAEQFG